MISWTIPGTVAGLTGVTIVTGSSSYSNTYSASGVNTFEGGITIDAESATGSGLTTYSFSNVTSVAASGRTTSGTESSSATYQGGTTFSATTVDENDVSGVETLTGTDAGGNTFSTSFSDTEAFTAQLQTSTTVSVVQFLEVTSSVTYDSPTNTVWTSSTSLYEETKTSTFFQPTEGTRTSSFGVGESQATVTIDSVTTLNQTVTLSALPDTVVQARTLYPDAEVIYLQTAIITGLSDYTAATDLAQSGTRFTVSPVIVTAAKESADYSLPTSSAESVLSTSLIVLTSSVFTFPATTRTAANYNFFPPTTFTVEDSGMSTTVISTQTNVVSSQPAITYGGTINTVTASEFGSYRRVVTRQSGSKTFQATVEDVTSYTVSKTLEAAATSSLSSTVSETYTPLVIDRPGPAAGRNDYGTFRSSGVTGNTVLPTARALIGGGVFLPSQSKFGTFGAAFGSQKGGWITANATSEFGVFSSWIYALDGGGRIATTMFPVTNEYETINATGITWTQSTAANLSIDGATSKKTTTSASFGLSGATQTTGIAQPIGNFGGSAGQGETFVQAAVPGVYKDRIGGSTTSFDGSATVITAGQSEPLVMWRAIRGVTGMASGTNANPATWTEARNSTALPPAMPPDA